MKPVQANWPLPADPIAAARLLSAFDNPALHGPVAAIGGNSPYLTDLALAEPDCLRAILTDGPDLVRDRTLTTLRATPHTTPRAELAAALRLAKRHIALATALADLGGLWSLEQVTAALSDLAEAALRLAVAHLLHTEAQARRLRLPHPADPARASGFTVLAMGKLGARELNYSSDIDLVLLFDPERHPYSTEGLGAIFTRIAHGLVALMAAREAGQYVFRTDLRLRPDPSSTPPAVSLPAAIAYYESAALTWERAAMIKARPIAGDLAAGRSFLDAIRPFLWRRHLDFAAIADIRALKRRMDTNRPNRLRHTAAPHATGATSERATGATSQRATGATSQRATGATSEPAKGAALERLAGHDIKLGQGGIREIEFCAQTLQLVWGGRDPALRGRGTLAALHELAAAGRLPQGAALELDAAYRCLRTVEHRLQMVDDRQTHTLPASPASLAAFALFMGEADPERFAARTLAHLNRVHRAFTGLFARLPQPPDSQAPDPLGADRLTSDSPESMAPESLPDAAGLARAGFADPARVLAVLDGWQDGQPRALRSPRARGLAASLVPTILAELSRQPDPDTAFHRFALLIERLPEGVGLLSMLQHNPALTARLADVLGASASLAEHLAAVPAALEGLLLPWGAARERATPVRKTPVDVTARQVKAGPATGGRGAAGRAAELEGPRDMRARMDSALADAASLDAALSLASRAVRGEAFRLAVAELDGRLDTDRAGRARTALADAAIAVLLPRVLADHVRRYGRVPGGALAVVALGRAGSRVMMEGSDLDLMLIYDHPETIEASDGARPVPASLYYARAAQAVVAALTVPTRDGPLYDVDMRLRPSGRAGPVAVSLRAFRRYHLAEAWTWERMALTRARIVTAPRAFRPVLRDAIAEATHAPRPAAQTLADAAAMRDRLRRDLPAAGAWDIKLRPGGLIDVEFIAQALTLVHAPPGGGPDTAAMLRALGRAGALPPADATRLIQADRTWRRVLSLLRILVGRTPPAEIGPALRDRLGVTDDAALDRLAAEVSAMSARFLTPGVLTPGFSMPGVLTPGVLTNGALPLDRAGAVTPRRAPPATRGRR